MPTENRSSAEARAVHLTQDREMRVYIAGPMTGLPDFNFPAFNAAAAMMRSAGWHVENPAEHGHVEGAEWADYLRYDIARLATCEMIMLLPGWSNSKGANLEVTIAQQLGMPIKLAEGAEAAQQHQGEPVAYVDSSCLRNLRVSGFDSFSALLHSKQSDMLSQQRIALYTHADPAEVERLRAVIEQQKNLIQSLRAELVESYSIDASAEQSAPVEIDERAEFERSFVVQEGVFFSKERNEYRSMNGRTIEETDSIDLNLRLSGWQARAALERKPSPHIPEGYCVMPRQLTAENGAKALLLGEFKLEVTHDCPECAELEEPAEGCEICDGAGEYGQRHTIPWDKIKFIYSEAVKGLAIKQ